MNAVVVNMWSEPHGGQSPRTRNDACKGRDIIYFSFLYLSFFQLVSLQRTRQIKTKISRPLARAFLDSSALDLLNGIPYLKKLSNKIFKLLNRALILVLDNILELVYQFINWSLLLISCSHFRVNRYSIIEWFLTITYGFVHFSLNFMLLVQ